MSEDSFCGTVWCGGWVSHISRLLSGQVCQRSMFLLTVFKKPIELTFVLYEEGNLLAEILAYLLFPP
jgi:hypothetical protein